MIKKNSIEERKGNSMPVNKYHSLGLYYFKMKEYSKAIEFFKKVLIVDPGHTDSKEKIRLLNMKINNKNMKNINLENQYNSSMFNIGIAKSKSSQDISTLENKILAPINKYSPQEYNELSSADVNSLQHINCTTHKNEDISVLHDIHIDKIQAMVIAMEKYYARYGTVVPIDTHEFSIIEIIDLNIINKRSDIFYKCTPKNIVLVKWIIDKIKEMFNESHNDHLLFSDIYQQFRIFFKHIDLFYW